MNKDLEAFEKAWIRDVNNDWVYAELSKQVKETAFDIWLAAIAYKNQEYSNIMDAMTRTSQNNGELKKEIDELKQVVRELREAVETTSKEKSPYVIHEHIDDLEDRFHHCIITSKEVLERNKEILGRVE